MKNLIASLTLEEKAALLTGAASMATAEISRLGIKGKNLADGPHGVRSKREDNCTHFPNLCCLGASWDVETAYKMGKGIGDDCIANDVQMILGPGVNIKRTPSAAETLSMFPRIPFWRERSLRAISVALRKKALPPVSSTTP